MVHYWSIRICGPIYDNRAGARRRKLTSWELQEELGLEPVSSFIIGQRIQRLGHIMRRNEKATVRGVLEWKPTGKSLAGDLERDAWTRWMISRK